jgi:ribosomal protein S18 acetylase RimI-like enzyme
MVNIYQVETSEDRDSVRQLFWEYLQWANTKINEEFGFSFDIETMLEEDMQNLDKFYPPEGRLLLAETDHQVAGIACLRKIKKDLCEVKRMYVRDVFRGMGIGRMLLEKLIEAAQESGYPCVRLDSARFMYAAHSLYRSSGFQEINPYPESEIPEEFQPNWIFMERKLKG